MGLGMKVRARDGTWAKGEYLGLVRRLLNRTLILTLNLTLTLTLTGSGLVPLVLNIVCADAMTRVGDWV